MHNTTVKTKVIFDSLHSPEKRILSSNLDNTFLWAGKITCIGGRGYHLHLLAVESPHLQCVYYLVLSIDLDSRGYFSV